MAALQTFARYFEIFFLVINHLQVKHIAKDLQVLDGLCFTRVDSY